MCMEILYMLTSICTYAYNVGRDLHILLSEGVNRLLSEKTKSFIEKLALDFQDEISVDSPNSYDVVSLVDFVNSMGCQIEFNKDYDRFHYINNIPTIYLKNDMRDKNLTRVEYISILRVFFHEVWHFISERININCNESVHEGDDFALESMSPNEASANYFSRAMIFPEVHFIQCVIRYTLSNGMCNIFEVAKHFNSTYTDVIARGNDLNLWNTKDGV